MILVIEASTSTLGIDNSQSQKETAYDDIVVRVHQCICEHVSVCVCVQRKRERLQRVCRVSHQQAREAGKSCSSPKLSLLVETSLFQRRWVFSSSPSTDCMRPTHIIEGNLLYSKFTDLNVISILTFIEVCRMMLNCSPAELTHKINHYKWSLQLPRQKENIVAGNRPFWLNQLLLVHPIIVLWP